MEKNGLKFRALRSDEIEVRVQSVFKSGGGFQLLLYKNARCDMAVLDESVGPLGWKREHSRENANCIVSIYDAATGQWVGKEDTGSESNVDKAKGQASDSFKRSCFNWGIGRELYTGPELRIFEKSYIKDGKVWEKFHVSHVRTSQGHITELMICDESDKMLFSWPSDSNKAKMKVEADKLSIYKGKVLESFDKFNSDLVEMVFEEMEGVTSDLDPDKVVADLVSKIGSKERLDNLGIEIKKRSEEP